MDTSQHQSKQISPVTEADIVTLMEHCILCPRLCGVNRAKGQRGFCGMDATLYAARAAMHYWEEPCISGPYDRGTNRASSGAIFFSGCSMRCIFCQNHSIATEGKGKAVSLQALADTMLRLQDEGAYNINLVTPTHYTPQIACVLERIRHRLTIPVVYNTSAYERTETLRMLDGLIDIYLPDYKYADPELAKVYSTTPDYPDVAPLAIAEMFHQVGDPVFGSEGNDAGIMKKGVIVRHLVLPGHTKNTIRILDELWENYGNRIYVSLMSQYTPVLEAWLKKEDVKEKNLLDLYRRITPREYEKVISHALALGMERVFIQERSVAKDSFIPTFSGEGLPDPADS